MGQPTPHALVLYRRGEGFVEGRIPRNEYPLMGQLMKYHPGDLLLAEAEESVQYRVVEKSESRISGNAGHIGFQSALLQFASEALRRFPVVVAAIIDAADEEQAPR